MRHGLEELDDDLWEALKKETLTEQSGGAPEAHVISEGGGSRRTCAAGGRGGAGGRSGALLTETDQGSRRLGRISGLG